MDVTIHDEPGFISRTRPIFIWFGALIVVVGGLYSAWNWGRAQVVTPDDLKGELRGLESKVNDQIGTTKVEVLRNTDVKTGEVKEDVSKVKSQLEVVIKQQGVSNVQQLETAARGLMRDVMTQKTTLANIQSQLDGDRKGDAFLIQRKAEVEALIRFLEAEQSNATDQLRRARMGN